MKLYLIAIPLLLAGNAHAVVGPGTGLIDQRIQRHMAQFSACYSRELTHNPNLGGRIETHFWIGTSGRVTKAILKSSTLDNPKVEKCVLKRLKNIVFPEARGGPNVDVDYPFEFSPQQGSKL
jgi:hypothetical protein